MPTIIDSNLNAIWNQGVAVVTGLLFTFGGNIVPVVKRKLPKKDETLDSVPLITVWVEKDADNAKWVSFNGWVITTYNLGISVISSNDGDELSNVQTYTDWRQRIRQKFQGPVFDSISTITDTSGNVSKILDSDSSRDMFLDNKMISDMYDYQTVGVAVKVVEPSSS